MPDRPGHVKDLSDILGELSPEQLQALLNPGAGYETVQEALDAGDALGIEDVGHTIINGRAFPIDLAVSAPDRTFKDKGEADKFKSSIHRPDFRSVTDPATGRVHLEAPKDADQSGPPRLDWIPQLGKFAVTFASGRQELVDPPQSRGSGQVTTTDIPGTDYILLNDGEGHIRTVRKSEAAEAPFQLGQVQERGGSQFVETSPGNFQRLPDQEEDIEAGVVTIGGRQFIRQPDGSLTPLTRERPLSIDEQISRAIASGNVEAAIALADFRDRPTSTEMFNAAMQFAQSPGDVVAISAIAKGQTLVNPPPAGEVQRIAEQPQFLQDAHARMQSLFRGGAGTPNDMVSILEAFAKSEQRAKEEGLAAQRQAGEEKNQRQLAEERAFRDKLQSQVNTALAVNKAQTAGGGAAGSPRFLDAGANPGARTPQQGDLARRLGLDLGAPRTLADRIALQREIQNAGFIPGGAGLLESAQVLELINELNAAPTLAAGGGGGGLPSAALATPPPISSSGGADSTGLPSSPPPLAGGGGGSGTTGLIGLPSPTPQLTTEQALAQIQQEEQAAREAARPTPPPSVPPFAEGGIIDQNGVAIVGEDGPELAILPVGTRVLSNEDSEVELRRQLRGGKRKSKGTAAKMSKEQFNEQFGIKSLQGGGIVDSLLPFGVQQALSGRAIEPTRRRLSTAAGIPVLSAQARANILPEDLDVLNRLRAEAGIPEDAFLQELRSANPGRAITQPFRFGARASR